MHERMKADPTDWLLAPQCLPVRYCTLADVVNRPPDDPEVRAAQAAVPTYPPVAALLATQGRDGHWGTRDYYLPRTSLGSQAIFEE